MLFRILIVFFKQKSAYEMRISDWSSDVCSSDLPDLRRRMIWESEDLRLRVRPSGLPQGDTGWRPPDVLPSPPPCGWSTGFITTPRTVGRLPFQRMRPALPQLLLDCSALPTSPIDDRKSVG